MASLPLKEIATEIDKNVRGSSNQELEKLLDDSATLTEAGLYEEAILTMQVLFFLILICLGLPNKFDTTV